MAGRVHALMQDADNGNAVAGWPEIDDMLLDAMPSIAWSDVGTALSLLRRFGRIGAGSFDKIGVAHRLGHAPMRYGIVEHPVQIALRPWGEPVFSHAARLCAA